MGLLKGQRAKPGLRAINLIAKLSDNIRSFSAASTLPFGAAPSAETHHRVNGPKHRKKFQRKVDRKKVPCQHVPGVS